MVNKNNNSSNSLVFGQWPQTINVQKPAFPQSLVKHSTRMTRNTNPEITPHYLNLLFSFKLNFSWGVLLQTFWLNKFQA